MGYDFDKRLLFFKVETTEGVEAVPVAADAVVTRGLQPVNWEADNRVREIDGQYFGARPQTQATRRGRTRFEVELTGSGGAATAVPAWMKLLRIGGMNAGVVGASSVVQSPITDDVPSATLWDYTDTLRQPLYGSRADFRIMFEDDQLPYFAMDVLGFPPAGLVTDAAPATPDVSAFADPIYANNANTVFLLDGYAAELRRLELVAGSVLAPRSFIGSADRVKYRNRVWSATAVIKCPDVATKNYFTSMNSSQVPMKITHGLTAGNIVEIEALRAEVGLAQMSDEEGDLMLSIPLRLIPSDTGNDEVTITSK